MKTRKELMVPEILGLGVFNMRMAVGEAVQEGDRQSERREGGTGQILEESNTSGMNKEISKSKPRRRESIHHQLNLIRTC